MASTQILGESRQIENFKIQCSTCNSDNCQVQAVISDYLANCITVHCLDCSSEEAIYDEAAPKAHAEILEEVE